MAFVYAFMIPLVVGGISHQAMRVSCENERRVRHRPEADFVRMNVRQSRSNDHYCGRVDE
jgi:hypothetical protein